jgi:hypothetical protein
MPGINNILDELFIPETIMLISEYYYDNNSIKNRRLYERIFNTYTNIIREFRIAKTFCRFYKLEFSKKFLLMSIDVNYSKSNSYRGLAYNKKLDEPRLQLLNTYDDIYDADYNLNKIETYMICNSYIKANKMSNLLIKSRIRFQCDKCINANCIIYMKENDQDIDFSLYSPMHLQGYNLENIYRAKLKLQYSYTNDDIIDNDHIAEFCLKHR